MNTSKQKEYALVIFFVLIIALPALYISKSHSQLQTVISKEQVVLDDQDFALKIDQAQLLLGNSTYAEVMKLFPKGKNLGMSTIYKPDYPDCLLTFNKDQEIVQKMHIFSPDIMTNRGVKVGDPFSAVTKQYGPNYSSVSSGKPGNFDAVYGVDSNIVFQIRDQKVKAIILQKEI